MTNEQKKLAEEIIYFIKENDNRVRINTLFNKFNLELIDKNFLVKTLKEFGIIRIDKGLYSLTKKGLSFVSFEEIENKEKIEFERQKLTDEKLKYDVKNSQRIFKTYWWTFTFSIIALIISLTLAILKLLEVFPL
jgi:predicted methyltransferase